MTKDVAHEYKSYRICIFCENRLTPDDKQEHILINALGGRKTTPFASCKICNEYFTNGPDKDMAESVAHLRILAGLKTGEGLLAPSKSNDKPITLKTPNISNSETIKNLIQELLKDPDIQKYKGPKLSRSSGFGSGKSQQSMVKSILVLWCWLLGNEELNNSRYSAARQFVTTGKWPDDLTKYLTPDARLLPTFKSKFGTNPNIIWAGSDAEGRAYGYFRLYGALGWRFLICSAGAPPNQTAQLISNPMRNENWTLIRGAYPISWDWVTEEYKLTMASLKQSAQQMQPLLEYAADRHRYILVQNTMDDALKEQGWTSEYDLTIDDATLLKNRIKETILTNLELN